MALRQRILHWLTNRLPARDITLHGKPYIDRFHVFGWGPLRVYLHQYHAPDGDREVHDHPWLWCLGIPLVGGYNEERLRWVCAMRGVVTKMRRIRPWRWNVMGINSAHRVAEYLPGTWTLFITWRRLKHWNFFVHDAGTCTREVRGGEVTSVGGTTELMQWHTPSDSSWHRTAPLGRTLREQRACLAAREALVA